MNEFKCAGIIQRVVYEGADACSKDECVGTDDYRALSVWVLGTEAI